MFRIFSRWIGGYINVAKNAIKHNQDPHSIFENTLLEAMVALKFEAFYHVIVGSGYKIYCFVLKSLVCNCKKQYLRGKRINKCTHCSLRHGRESSFSFCPNILNGQVRFFTVAIAEKQWKHCITEIYIKLCLQKTRILNECSTWRPRIENRQFLRKFEANFVVVEPKFLLQALWLTYIMWALPSCQPKIGSQNMCVDTTMRVKYAQWTQLW